MIEDFGSLAELDLTDSIFICNEGVEKFVLMASEKSGLEIKGYVEGWGYSCKTSNNEVKSFASYAVSNTGFARRVGPRFGDIYFCYFCLTLAAKFSEPGVDFLRPLHIHTNSGDKYST